MAAHLVQWRLGSARLADRIRRSRPHIVRQLVVAEELAVARAPVPIGFQAVELLAPTLIQHASEAQKAKFLPRILSGEDIWCQGYSEPDAGERPRVAPH